MLEDWEKPDDHPNWASVSPDGQTVIFARNDNLFMMSGDSYQQILDARRGKDGDDADEADQAVEVEEIGLTTDGEQHYSYANFDRGDTDPEREKTKDEREEGHDLVVARFRSLRPSSGVISERRGISGVIHSVGNRRPELETYPVRHGWRGEHHAAGAGRLRPRDTQDGCGRRGQVQGPEHCDIERQEVRVSGPPRA